MKINRIGLVTLILLSSVIACRMNVGGPKPTGQPVIVSTEAAGSLQQQFEQALQNPDQNGQITLTINESQLTSLLAAKLASNPDPLLTDPQVYLRDGQIQIYGKASKGYFEANVGIILTATIDSNGQPLIKITSADFGPIPVPENLTASISSLVQEAYTGALGPMAIGFKLNSIAIADGLMMLKGSVQ
jgi:hypothetical protein